MPDNYKELIKSNPDETEIRSFLVNGNQVSVTLRIPDTLRDAAKEEAALSRNEFLRLRAHLHDRRAREERDMSMIRVKTSHRPAHRRAAGPYPHLSHRRASRS